MKKDKDLKKTKKPSDKKTSSPFLDESKNKILVQMLGVERVKFNEPLKYHIENETTGNASVFYVATSFKELEQALNIADELELPRFLIGAGTKMFVGESGLEGFVIKNRSGAIKISGVKGKVSASGIGVEEALVEVDSGVSLQRINEFLKTQGLNQMNFPVIPSATIGGSLYVTPALLDMTQKIKVWADRQIFDIDIPELKSSDIVMSVIFKVRSAI